MSDRQPVLSFWTPKEWIPVSDQNAALSSQQLCCVLQNLISPTHALVSLQETTDKIDGGIVIMDPLLLPRLQQLVDTEGVMMADADKRLGFLLDREVFKSLEQKICGRFPNVIFPIQVSDNEWSLGVLTAMEDEVVHFIILDVSSKSQTYTETIKAFTVKLNTLLRTGPRSSLRVHHVDQLSDHSGLLIVSLIKDLVTCSEHWIWGDEILHSVDGMTRSQVISKDNESEVQAILESLPNGLDCVRSTGSVMTLQLRMNTTSFTNFAENLEDNRLIFSDALMQEMKEMKIEDEFKSLFLSDVTFEEFLETRKKGVAYSQMTPWNYDFLTRYAQGQPLEEDIPGLPGFERLEIKKRDYLDFITEYTSVDRIQLESKLQNMASCRRLDRKLVDLRYNYVRNASNHAMILRSRTTATKRKLDHSLSEQGNTKTFKRMIHPLDLMHFAYYTHSRLGNHGSVRTSFDTVKNEVDNVTRDMVWFMCNKCKHCESKSNVNGNTEVADKPFKRLLVTLIDMSTHALDGFGWILAIRDEFSQFVWLFALPDKKASTVRKSFEEFLLRTTFPEEVASSNAVHILAVFLKDLLPEVQPIQTTNQEFETLVVQHLRALMKETAEVTGDKLLPSLCRSINHSTSPIINTSPSNVLFSRMAISLEKRRFQSSRTLGDNATVTEAISKDIWPGWQGSVEQHELLPDDEVLR